MAGRRVSQLGPYPGFARSVTKVAGGSIAGQALLVLATPILTRIYSVSELGAFAVFAALLSTLVPVVSLRFELAVPLPERDADAVDLVGAGQIAVVAMSSALLVVALLASGPIAEMTHSPVLAEYLWLLPLGLGAAGTYQVLSYWAIRRSEFAAIGTTRLLQSAGQGVFQVGAGLAGAGTLGLMTGDVLGRSLGSGLLFRRLVRDLRTLELRASWRGIRAQAVRFKKFPLVGAWAALTNSAGSSLTPLLIAAVYGPVQAGLFAITQRVMSMPLSLVGQPMGQVYFGRAAELLRADPGAVRGLYARTARLLLGLGIVTLVPFALVAPLLVPALFGEDWRRAAVYVQALAVLFVTQLIVVPLSQTLYAVGRQGRQLAWDVARLIALFGVFGLASSEGWDPVEAVLAYSVAMTSLYVVLGWMGFRAAAAGGATA